MINSGFTLPELIIAVAIVGILSTLGLPNYLNAVHRARQSDASSQIMTILTSIQAYQEEFLENPGSWDDIAQIKLFLDWFLGFVIVLIFAFAAVDYFRHVLNHKCPRFTI